MEDMKPETCSDCEECIFSWYDNAWHCGDGSDGPTLDNDIYMSAPDDCPLRRDNIEEVSK